MHASAVKATLATRVVVPAKSSVSVIDRDSAHPLERKLGRLSKYCSAQKNWAFQLVMAAEPLN